MIAKVHSAVSSVTRLAEAACAAEGVTLAEVIANRPRNTKGFSHRPRKWSVIFHRVVLRCRTADDPPSNTELAHVFGTNHATIRYAERGGRKRAAAEHTMSLIDSHGLDGLVAIGAKVASRLPMYDDGEDDRDGRGLAEGSKATRYKSKT